MLLVVVELELLFYILRIVMIGFLKWARTVHRSRSTVSWRRRPGGSFLTAARSFSVPGRNDDFDRRQKLFFHYPTCSPQGGVAAAMTRIDPGGQQVDELDVDKLIPLSCPPIVS